MTMKDKSIDPRTVGIPKKKLGLSGVFEAVFRENAWSTLNLEANAFGTLPAYPWRKDSYTWEYEGQHGEEEEV